MFAWNVQKDQLAWHQLAWNVKKDREYGPRKVIQNFQDWLLSQSTEQGIMKPARCEWRLIMSYAYDSLGWEIECAQTRLSEPNLEQEKRQRFEAAVNEYTLKLRILEEYKVTDQTQCFLGVLPNETRAELQKKNEELWEARVRHLFQSDYA